jgi:hypothetical protein
MFLCDTYKADESVSNINEELIIDDNNSEIDNYSDTPLPNTSTYQFDSETSPEKSYQKNKKIKTNNDIKNDFLKSAIDFIKAPETVDDEEMSFCRSLAASMRRLPNHLKEIAKLELTQVMFKFSNQMHNETYNS